MLTAFMNKHRLPDSFAKLATQCYQPEAERIYQLAQQARRAPFFVGINGCQGSGKSTCAQFLADYLSERYHLTVLSMSLDDFYFDRQQRQHLAETVHPLLITRGVPGTHNTTQLSDVLTKLSQHESNLKIPGFDKATDNPKSQEQWCHIDYPVDMVLVEGWCWGVPAQTEKQMREPVNPLEATYDADGVWRRYVNTSLERDYQPLYSMMDYWLVLQAPSFDVVYQWRAEQESKLSQDTECSNDKNRLMNDQQLAHFIQHFQRLTEHGFRTLPTIADSCLYLDAQREVIAQQSKGLS
ncbi:kinase [Thalassotalea ganghwensis]